MLRHPWQRGWVKELTGVCFCRAFADTNFAQGVGTSFLWILICSGGGCGNICFFPHPHRISFSLGQFRFRPPRVVLGFEDPGICARHTFFRIMNWGQINMFSQWSNTKLLLCSFHKDIQWFGMWTVVPTIPTQIENGCCFAQRSSG